METESVTVRVGLIGAGRMATALARGLISAGFATAEDICACDISDAARQRFVSETSAKSTSSMAEVVRGSQIVVLAVKPQQMPDVLQELSAEVTSEQIVVSIAAGVTLEALSAALGEATRLFRVMPNTSCLVSQGASAFAPGGASTTEDASLVKAMLATVGLVEEVTEAQLDAVTGLSGSGPAYVFQIIEALSDGGVSVGLPRDVASRLAAQTVLGAAQMVLQTDDHPGVLRDAVTSPGGTTIAGLHAMEQAGVRAALMNAVRAATHRSQELGRS